MTQFETGKDMPNLELARANFSAWNEALLSKDPKKVAGFYSDDCTFLPTVNGEFKKGTEQAEGYFEHFLEKDPEGVIVEDACQALGPDTYLHSGLYNFTLGPADNRQIVEARFSYVWKKDATGAWKVIHHHSSVRPK